MLAGQRWARYVWVDSVLCEVDLSKATLRQVTLRRTEWRGCRAIGLRLSIEHAADLYVEDCRFDYATIHLESVRGAAVFTGCSFREATLRGNLSDVPLVDCDLRQVEFQATRAERCDLRGSRLDEAQGLLGAMITAQQALLVAPRLAAEAGLRVSG